MREPSRIFTIAIVIVATLLLGTILVATTPSAQEVLTNELVLTMVRAGLPEGVIVAKIRSSQTRFDLSTSALVALKQAGVPDRVLEAMASQAAAATAPPSAPPAPGLLGPAPQAGSMALYHEDGGKLVELKPVAGKIESTFAPFFGAKQELVVPSRRAEYRIADRQPIFRAANFPPEAQLARLRPGGKDDRNLKMLRIGPFGGTTTQGPDEDAVVKIVTERDAQGWTRIRPAQALAPGEYGFVLGSRLWDFGVD